MATIITYSLRSRLQKIIIYGGLVALRSTVYNKLKNENISLRDCLNQAKEKIKILNKTCVITDVQYMKLFPDGGKDPRLDDFDITLITCLLINVETLRSAVPDIEEDLEKLITYTNEISRVSSTGDIDNEEFENCCENIEKISRVSSTGDIDNEEFENYCENIEKVLVRLSDPALNIKEKIKGYKTSPLNIVEAERLKEAIKTWTEVYNAKQKHETAQAESSINSWTTCIKQTEKLVEEGTLPSKEELDYACRVFGIHSPVILKMCTLIGTQIKKNSEDVLDVKESYQSNKHSSDSCATIVFVVTVKKNSTFSGFEDYPCYKRYEDDFNDEGETVASKNVHNESSFGQSRDKTLETLKQIRLWINEKADDLFDRHSNLNMILPSLKKSTGYMKENKKHEINIDPCIAFYVTVKGCIPLNEEPFEKEIREFKIDVLEGEFEPLSGKPDAFHEHLKIGLKIHAKDNSDCGTLGGFVNHSEYQLCGITCAHVLYDFSDIRKIKENNTFEFKDVCQPDEEPVNTFGQVVKAIVREGSNTEPGLEVALIKIARRHPIDGSFPDDPNGIVADPNIPLTYNSGKVCEASQLNYDDKFYKFGISSGMTTGEFGICGAALRKREIDVPTLQLRLKDQIVILSQNSKPFVKSGDSGALVLKQERHDPVSIGIVHGRSVKTRHAFVTPICDILRAVGCSALKMHQFT